MPNADQELQAIAAPTSMQRHRFHLLDGMRGIAAILVVFFHLPLLFKHALNFPNGYLAVDFFFCLSGFVIAFSYEDRLRNQLNFRDFMVIRWIRLYPLYAIGTLIGVTRFFIDSHTLQHPHSVFAFPALFGCSAFLIPNVFLLFASTSLFPLNLPAWSLFLELSGNAVYALLIRCRLDRTPLALICLVSVGILGLLSMRHHNLDLGSSRESLGDGFVRFGFSFCAGVFLCRSYLRKSTRQLKGWRSGITSLLIVAALAAVLATPHYPGIHAIPQFLIVAILFPASVYIGAHCTLPRQLNPICTFLGESSYPLYVLHFPLLPPDRVSRYLISPAHHYLQYTILVYVAFLVVGSYFVGDFFDSPVRGYLTKAYKAHIAKQKAPIESPA